jgi:hypothetical protein
MTEPAVKTRVSPLDRGNSVARPRGMAAFLDVMRT